MPDGDPNRSKNIAYAHWPTWPADMAIDALEWWTLTEAGEPHPIATFYHNLFDTYDVNSVGGGFAHFNAANLLLDLVDPDSSMLPRFPAGIFHPGIYPYVEMEMYTVVGRPEGPPDTFDPVGEARNIMVACMVWQMYYVKLAQQCVRVASFGSRGPDKAPPI